MKKTTPANKSEENPKKEETPEDFQPLKISSVLMGIAFIILVWLISIAIFK